jgi:hypothetical protein
MAIDLLTANKWGSNNPSQAHRSGTPNLFSIQAVGIQGQALSSSLNLPQAPKDKGIG